MNHQIKLALLFTALTTGMAQAKAPQGFGRFVFGVESSRAFLPEIEEDSKVKDDANIYLANLKAGYEFAYGKDTSITPTVSLGYKNTSLKGLVDLTEIGNSPMYDTKIRVDFNKYLHSAPNLRFYGGVGLGYQWVNSDIAETGLDAENLDALYFIGEVGMGYQLFNHVELFTGYGYGYGFSEIKGTSHSWNAGINILF